MRDAPPGDDAGPVPPPVTEKPPYDRFCDLVMTGGVASGVVYPWAVVEIARAFRFRNIGGTSVGAMAAALTAAAEYGRRVGFEHSFEVLRRAPGALGEELPDGRTRMLSLFQTEAKGRRLITLWGQIGKGQQAPPKGTGSSQGTVGTRPEPQPLRVSLGAALRKLMRAYRLPMIAGATGLYAAAMLALVLVLVAYDSGLRGASATEALAALAHRLQRLNALGWVSMAINLVLLIVGAVAGLLWSLWRDIRLGVIDNNLGLCKGGTFEGPDSLGPRPGLVQWLHEGIQASAGLKQSDRPLTFRDLWCAPPMPGEPHVHCTESDPASQRSINLQAITTNVTHGRPYRLPLDDEASRLFYKPLELKDYFPKSVLDALMAASRPYAPRSRSDPPSIPDAEQFLELPAADLPLVVAARLSLSFPLLFSAVPLWAIDFERPKGSRELRRCLFTDGGASSNFPVHLFDAALPRWPTFGLWLDRRDPRAPRRTDTKEARDEYVWLPEFHEQGWGDNWNRFEPEAGDPPGDTARSRCVPQIGPFKLLRGFLLALLTSAVDWRDRTSFRLPHVRNRVARLWLDRGEGGLHIGMSRQQILTMASRYGANAGMQFVKRFAGEPGSPSEAWEEQRWVRLQLLIIGLRERLSGLAACAQWSAHTTPLDSETVSAAVKSPIRDRRGHGALSAKQAQSVAMMLEELEQLEIKLLETDQGAYVPFPKPELRLRAPL